VTVPITTSGGNQGNPIKYRHRLLSKEQWRKCRTDVRKCRIGMRKNAMSSRNDGRVVIPTQSGKSNDVIMPKIKVEGKNVGASDILDVIYKRCEITGKNIVTESCKRNAIACSDSRSDASTPQEGYAVSIVVSATSVFYRSTMLMETVFRKDGDFAPKQNSTTILSVAVAKVIKYSVPIATGSKDTRGRNTVEGSLSHEGVSV